MTDEVVNIISSDNIVWPEYRSPNPLPVEPIPVLEITTPVLETEAASESPKGV